MIDHNKANNKIHTRTGLIIILFVLALIFAVSLVLNYYYQERIRNIANNGSLLLPNSFKPLPSPDLIEEE